MWSWALFYFFLVWQQWGSIHSSSIHSVFLPLKNAQHCKNKLMIKLVHNTGVIRNLPERLCPAEETLSHCTEPWRCWLLLLLCVWSDSGEGKKNNFFLPRFGWMRKVKRKHSGCPLTSGNFGCVLLMAWDAALTAWASSCSNSPLVFAASHILPLGTEEESCVRNWPEEVKCCRVTEALDANTAWKIDMTLNTTPLLSQRDRSRAQYSKCITYRSIARANHFFLHLTLSLFSK